MPADNGFAAHCLELLTPLGQPRARRMFGGHGLYVDDCFVALIINEVLYLKADETARPAFATAGCQPFCYTTTSGQRAVMAYWSAPDEAMESPVAMLPWARLAMASALRAANAKRPAVAGKRQAVAAKQPAMVTKRPAIAAKRPAAPRKVAPTKGRVKPPKA